MVAFHEVGLFPKIAGENLFRNKFLKFWKQTVFVKVRSSGSAMDERNLT
jgi:hypothetical protein